MTSNKYPITRRLALFPIRTAIDPEGDSLTIGGFDLARLAEEYGTPLYLYDQATILDAIHRYQQALERVYPGPSDLSYAGKAYLCLAIAQWMGRQGLRIDCGSAQELHIAVQANVPRDQIVLHGVNKSLQDILAGIRNARIMVVDNPFELEVVQEQIRRSPQPFPQIWLRWRPGVSVETHSHTQTALTESKFGFSSEEIFAAVRACLDTGLPLAGLHFHLGSNFREFAPLEQTIRKSIHLLAALRTATGWTASSLSPGGGLGIPYHEDDLPAPSIDEYVTKLAKCIQETCRSYALPLPHLQLEPGRSLVGRAGVALYRVGGLKQAGERRWVLLDGGLADNPRPALYGSRYTALPAEGVHRPGAGRYTLGGWACESGDTLIEDLVLPELSPGELVAIPTSGAYQLSMSSRYNGALRPAVLWLEDQKAYLIQERESLEDLTRHDLLPD